MQDFTKNKPKIKTQLCLLSNVKTCSKLLIRIYLKIMKFTSHKMLAENVMKVVVSSNKTILIDQLHQINAK